MKPRITAPNGQELVLLTPGKFSMGSSRREPGRRANEVLRDVTSDATVLSVDHGSDERAVQEIRRQTRLRRLRRSEAQQRRSTGRKGHAGSTQRSTATTCPSVSVCRAFYKVGRRQSRRSQSQCDRISIADRSRMGMGRSHQSWHDRRKALPVGRQLSTHRSIRQLRRSRRGPSGRSCDIRVQRQSDRLRRRSRRSPPTRAGCSISAATSREWINDFYEIPNAQRTDRSDGSRQRRIPRHPRVELDERHDYGTSADISGLWNGRPRRSRVSNRTFCGVMTMRCICSTHASDGIACGRGGGHNAENTSHRVRPSAQQQVRTTRLLVLRDPRGRQHPLPPRHNLRPRRQKRSPDARRQSKRRRVQAVRRHLRRHGRRLSRSTSDASALNRCPLTYST